MANYIGGMLKGAGPLFQKMMQGLPTAGLPKELEGAVEDMKSKLAPIPYEIVEAELNSIVEGSHKQIKNISVIRSLGAASVGQTFLCKITRSDGTEEEAAIKLLKPDVRNRMMREKELMIRCARQTDIIQREKDNTERAGKGQKLLPPLKEDEKGGMQVTYEGQLKRIEEELDLTIEARNVELGRIYDKSETEGDEKVVSMKLNTLIQLSVNSMVLEKAPRETVDSLLKRMKKQTQEVRDVYKARLIKNPDMSPEEIKQQENYIKAHPYYSNALIMQEMLGIERFSKEWDGIQPGPLQEKLMEHLTELKRKKEYLDTFARKWTVEGMFGEGFYHGDPHEGNIMVDDEKLTVIDFGNCTKLSDDQKLQITRMLAAASIGDMEDFRHGFHMLLRPEFEDLYQQKRTELGDKLLEIFAMGDKRACGARIAVALLEAQKLGLEVPAAVYNFSQGQMRLQNAIDHFNEQIKETENLAKDIIEQIRDDDNFDFTDITMLTDISQTEDVLTAAGDACKKDMIIYSDSEEDLKVFAFDQPEALRRTGVDSVERDLKNLNTVISDFDDIIAELDTARQHPRQTDAISLVVRDVFKKAERIIPPSLVDEAVSCVMDENTDQKKLQGIRLKLKQIGENSDSAALLSAYKSMTAKQKAILAKHDQNWKPTQREEMEYNELRERFVKAFIPFHRKYIYKNTDFSSFFKRLTDPTEREALGSNIESFFRRYPSGKEEFMEKYNAFIKAQDDRLQETDSAAFREKKEILRSAYLKVMQQRIRQKEKIYASGLKKCDKDFLDIMADIIEENKYTLGKRLGFFKSISFKWKADKLDKQEKYLNS